MAKPNIFDLLSQISETSSIKEEHKIEADNRRQRKETILSHKEENGQKQKISSFLKTVAKTLRSYKKPMAIVGQKQKIFEDPTTALLHLLKKQPDAAKKKDRCDSRTPLHWAIYKGAPLEVMAALLEVWPHAAKEKDRYGDTPLLLACDRGAPVEVVAAVLEVWPHAAKQKDKYDRTPLHWACYKASPLKVVAALLKAWPGAAKEKK